jgi:osmoprotectant transport system permease protein
VSDVLAFIADHRGDVVRRVLEHVQISGIALLVALAVALPIALWLAHSGRGGFLAINAANVGRALPSLAIIAIVFSLPGFGLRKSTVIFALVLLGIPPVLTNAYVAVRGVDRDVVEAASGMGMRGMQILRGVELPLAAPVIMAGVRTAAVQIVATATLGALVASGGLGTFIVDGIAVQDTASIVTGALLVAVLAILVDVAFGVLERAVTPAGLAAAGEPAGRGRGRARAGTAAGRGDEVLADQSERVDAR